MIAQPRGGAQAGERPRETTPGHDTTVSATPRVVHTIHPSYVRQLRETLVNQFGRYSLPACEVLKL